MTAFDHPITISAGSDGLVAVLLAGGKGTRLGHLTTHESKPAVEFTGGRRIVDFVMGNALRSEIQSILVCTQWQPETLISHLRAHWASAFARGLVFRDGSQVAQPEGYLGTAHAVAANAVELDAAGAREVLVLAADHVYAMDYRDMIAEHRAVGLPVTVAVLPVARETARSFGVFETNGPCHAVRFLEKPDDPPPMFGDPGRSLISMGIYMFDWAWLREMIRSDTSPASQLSLDFGKDLLPTAVSRGEVGVFCFRTPGMVEPPYWRDVGTISALTAARADLTGSNPPIPLPTFPSAEPELVLVVRDDEDVFSAGT